MFLLRCLALVCQAESGVLGEARTGSCRQNLARDHVGISALNVDCPGVPMVDDGEVGTDLFVSTGPQGDSPGVTLVLEDPSGS